MKESRFILHEWCYRKKIYLRYKTVQNTPWSFLSELSLPGINYTAFGNGPSKRCSETIVATNMVKFLIDTGELNLSDFKPAHNSKAHPNKKEETPSTSKGPATPERHNSKAHPIRKKETPSTSKGPATPEVPPKFQSTFKALPTNNETPSTSKSSAEASDGPSASKDPTEASKGPSASRDPSEAYKGCLVKEHKIEPYKDDEDFKADPSLHGNWNISNSRFKLQEYCRLRNIPLDYKIIKVGRNLSCEIDLYIESKNRRVIARKFSDKREVAMRLCALSVIRQLYHLGEVDAMKLDDPLAIKPKKFNEDDEDFKADPSLHGNWDMSNSKTKLTEYCALRNIPLDYKKTTVPLLHSGSTICGEVTLYIESLKKTVYARKYAVNKIWVDKLCALSIVRQLYHLGEIDVFGMPDPLRKPKTKRNRFYVREEDDADGVQESQNKRKRKRNAIPFEVIVEKDLIQNIDKYLKTYGIEPVKVPKFITNEETVCLVSEKSPEENAQNKPCSAGVVSWLPPQPRWNPWTRSNIDEGSFSDMSLSDISELLKLEYDYRVENDADVQKMLENQKKLAVYQFKEDILYTSYQNSVTIIKGTPDCGKTTQVPQYILNAYLQANCGAKCSIVVTQPLCLHAVSAAEIVARERVESPGNIVGFEVKFESCLPRPYGSILYCDASVFLRKLENGMRGISHVIVDNIQERDIFTDITMAILKDMVRANPELHVILMCSSDVTLYYEYFGKCPVIEVTGPNFPVKEYFLEDCIELTNYVPAPKPESEVLEDEMKEIKHQNEGKNMNKVIDAKYSEATREAMALIREKETDIDLIIALLKYIVGLEDDGTVLIVGPDWWFIYEVTKHLKQLPDFNCSDYSILPLHDWTTKEDLYNFLDPEQKNSRKIIVASDIAETSVLICDAVYVIDSCRLRKAVNRHHTYRLSYFNSWASKESLQQRKIRGGSVKPGYVFRLCSQARSEILWDRNVFIPTFSSIHEIYLLIKLLHLGGISEFLSKVIRPLEVKDSKINEEYLRDFGAFNSFNELTSLGKLLARLPLEPRLGKMIIMSCIFKIADPLCFIAAYEIIYHFNKLKETFIDISNFKIYKPSDHLITLNILTSWEEKFQEGEKVAEQFCEDHSLVHETLLNAYNVKNYLKDLLVSAGFSESCFEPQTFKFDVDDERLDMVLACLCAGHYSSNLGIYVGSRMCLTSDGLYNLVLTKSCVRFRSKNNDYPSPYVVFSGKVVHKPSFLREVSVITPLTLLLFGCKKAEFRNGNIFVDKWTRFQSSPGDIAKILALHFPIKHLVDRVTGDPKILTCLSSEVAQLAELIQSLCKTNAFKIKWQWPEKPEETEGPPAKKGKHNGDADSGEKSKNQKNEIVVQNAILQKDQEGKINTLYLTTKS